MTLKEQYEQYLTEKEGGSALPTFTFQCGEGQGGGDIIFQSGDEDELIRITSKGLFIRGDECRDAGELHKAFWEFLRRLQ